VASKVPLANGHDLSVAYTPGVAEPCKEIKLNKDLSFEYTCRGNMVAVVSDGTRVLGLGDIGPEAAMPVMEGKSVLFKIFGDVDAVPICIDTKDPAKIIETVKILQPSFAGINLEDLSSPKCYDIEDTLKREMDIPVFHDDQHGTAIVVLAGLINSLKVVEKDKSAKVIISGAGAAGIAIAELLAAYGFTNYCLCDSKGVVSSERADLNVYKEEAVERSTSVCQIGACAESLEGVDILIGVSQPNQFTADDIRKMNADPVVFALANPVPEIMPEEAKKGGAKVVATGRSDFPNQINNALVFPGLFRGLLDNNIKKVTTEIKIAVAETLAGLVDNPTPENIIPSIFDKRVVQSIANTIKTFK
jgi:malate dehydrogenase (oxaloacetate-decarboxylating)